MTDNSQKPAVPNYTPDVGRLVTDRFDFQAHVNGSGFNHVAGSILLSPHLNISGHGTFTDVQDILAQLATLASAPVVPNATTITPGLVQLSGDISGTFNNVVVVNIQGRPVTTAPPALNNVLTWNGSAWNPAPSPAATGAASGDLAGTYPAPTVIAINGASVPPAGALVTGQVLQVNGTSSLTYGNVSVAGDVTGNNTATTVVKIQNNPIQSGALGASQDGYALTWVNGSTQWQAQPSVRNLARNFATNLGTVGPVVSVVIVCSATITPAVTGKIRVTVNGYVTYNPLISPPTIFNAYGIYVTNGASLGPGDFTQFLGEAQASTGSDGYANLSTVSYAYDYDKIPTPITFPLGTPVTFHVILNDLVGNKFQVNPNGIQLEVQEVF